MATKKKPKKKRVPVMTAAELKRQVQPIIDRIASERDKLRDVLEDVGDIASNADQAVDELEAAVDHLSELL